MKKNRMMRSASALLVMVLLTTSVISGTFAKYVTQDSAYDTARVAKWGVELQAVGNLYGDTYKDLIVKENDSTLTVQSVDKTADVVAPGTKNDEGFTFSLKGQPEVDGTITTEMKIQNVFLKAGKYGVMIPVDTGVVTEANFSEFVPDKATNPDDGDYLYTKDASGNFVKANAKSTSFYTLEDYVVVSDDYYPVVYKLVGNTANDGNDATDTLKDAADKVAAQLGLTADVTASTSVDEIINKKAVTTYKGTKTFDANTDLATLSVDGLTLTWAWAFGDPDKVGDDADENDKADTILGMIKNTSNDVEVVKFNNNGTGNRVTDDFYEKLTEYTDYCLDTQFSIDITVTQVD